MSGLFVKKEDLKRTLETDELERTIKRFKEESVAMEGAVVYVSNIEAVSEKMLTVLFNPHPGFKEVRMVGLGIDTELEFNI